MWGVMLNLLVKICEVTSSWQLFALWLIRFSKSVISNITTDILLVKVLAIQIPILIFFRSGDLLMVQPIAGFQTGRQWNLQTIMPLSHTTVVESLI